jgi:hypothetical protein
MSTNPAPEMDDVFEMEEPRQIGMNTAYGFWLTTQEGWVVKCTADAGCVAGVLEVEDGRFLVEIDDNHDPDEAWHWIRTLLEEERRPDDPDSIWEEALRWIL